MAHPEEGTDREAGSPPHDYDVAATDAHREAAQGVGPHGSQTAQETEHLPSPSWTDVHAGTESHLTAPTVLDVGPAGPADPHVPRGHEVIDASMLAGDAYAAIWALDLHGTGAIAALASVEPAPPVVSLDLGHLDIEPLLPE